MPRQLYAVEDGHENRRGCTGIGTDYRRDRGFGVWQREQRLRLLGIDAPEMTGSDRPEGEKSKAWLEERIEGRDLIVTTFKVGLRAGGAAGDYFFVSLSPIFSGPASRQLSSMKHQCMCTIAHDQRCYWQGMHDLAV